MTWTLRDAKQEKAIVDEIEKGDDRSAAILAEALLEDRLKKAILTRLRDDKVIVGQLFNGYGPLASFKGKIDLGFLMGVIDEEYKMFNAIREIRNRFAHRLDAHSFDAPMIADLCKKLPHIEGIKRLKQHVTGINASEGDDAPNIFALWIEPMISLPDTARNAYMNTIKILLLMMEMGTHFASLDRGGKGFVLELSVPEASPEKFAQQPPLVPQTGDHVQRKPRHRPGSSQE